MCNKLVYMKTILGIGNAITDIPVLLPDNSLLERAGLVPGSMTHIDKDAFSILWEELGGCNLMCYPGGSAANTVVGAVQLGMKGRFAGKAGPDETGVGFAGNLQDKGVYPYLMRGNMPSGRAFEFINTSDGERTFAVYLGAALEFLQEELMPDMFDGCDYLHIEGYLLQAPGVVEKAMKMAASRGMTISLDLGSAGIVRRYREVLERLVTYYADIVFANEQEAGEFTGNGPVEAVGKIASMGSKPLVAVVKLGAEGSLIQSGGKMYRVHPYPANEVDSTGAGDAYAAGFLYAHACGADVYNCAKAGSVAASKVVAEIGPGIPEYSLAEVKSIIGACSQR